MSNSSLLLLLLKKFRKKQRRQSGSISLKRYVRTTSEHSFLWVFPSPHLLVKRAGCFVVIAKLVGLDILEAFEGFWKRSASLEFQENSKRRSSSEFQGSFLYLNILLFFYFAATVTANFKSTFEQCQCKSNFVWN